MSVSSPTDSSASASSSPIGEPAEPEPPGPSSMIGSDGASQHQQGGVAAGPAPAGAQEPDYPSARKLFFTAEMRDRQARGKDPYALAATAVGLLEQQHKLIEHLQGKQRRQHARHHETVGDGAHEQDQSTDAALGDNSTTAASGAAASTAPANASAAAGNESGVSGTSSSLHQHAMRVRTENVIIYDQVNYMHWNSEPHPNRRLPDSNLDNFELLDRRRHAAVVLDTPELLMMYAQSSGDSLPATRWRFTQILCGYDEEAAVSALTHGQPPDALRMRTPSLAEYGRRWPGEAEAGSSASAAAQSAKRKLPNWAS